MSTVKALIEAEIASIAAKADNTNDYAENFQKFYLQ